MATNRPPTEPEETEALERAQVRATLESPERFQQPFLAQRINRILPIGRYVFCFRQNWQLPMIYGGGSEPLPLTGGVEVSDIQDDLDVKGRRIPRDIVWRVTANDIANGFELQYKFLRDQFPYDDYQKVKWLPVLLAPPKRQFVDDVSISKNGTITYALSIPNSNFSVHNNSLYRGYYQDTGLLLCIIKPDGTYSWQARHFRNDVAELRKLRTNYLATLDTAKKREVTFGQKGEIAGILEIPSDAKIYDSGIARFFREGQESENLDAVNDLCINPIDPTEAFITIEGKVHRYRVEDKKLVEKKLFFLPDSIGYVLDFQCDPHGNFAVVLHYDRKEKKGKIAMVNLITGEAVFELKSDINCAGPLGITKAGQIFFQEVFTEEEYGKNFERYRMRYLKSNLATFSPGEAARLRDREAEIAKRVREGLEASGVAGLLASLPAAKKREVQRGKSVDVAVAEEALDTQLAAFVAEITGKAEVSSAELREALDRVITLSRQPDYALFGSIFKKHIDVLHKACERVRALEIAKELEALGTAEAQSVQANDSGNGSALALFERLDLQFRRAEELIHEMGHLSEGNRVAVPAELASRREGIRTRINELREQTSSELSARIEGNLTKLRELIATIDEAFILETVWKGELVKSIDADIRGLPDVARQLAFAEQLKGIFDERREAIQVIERERQAAREAELKMFEKKAELELSEIRSQLMVLPDENAIQAFKLTSPTVAAFGETLKKLPPERANFMRVKLEDIFASAIATLEARKNVREFEGDVVAFGKVKFPRFKPEVEDKQETWRLSPVRTQAGEILLELRSNLDRIAEIPDEILLNAERPLLMSRDDYKRLMADTSSYLHTFVKDHSELIPQKSKRNVPEMSPKWEYSEHVERNLEEFAEALAIQRRNQEGITILEGEAGTGKNVLIDMFAHHTNQEVFMFTCNAKTDKEDLTRFYDYDPVRGTYRLNSRVIEAITTPGAILVLDEINTLPPEVAKMLNALLDYRRTLFPSEGGRFGKTEGFKADEEVLMVGTMNPQNYAGVQKLSPEIVSRSSVVRIDYPKMQDAENRYRVDEVLLYRKYLPQLAAFTREQFITMWHAVINNVNRKAVDALITPEIEALLRDLKILLVTANKFRKAYMDYKLGKGMEELDFVFSLREGANIVQRYAFSGADIKGAIRKVVLPKIWDEQQRQKVDTDIIAQV